MYYLKQKTKWRQRNKRRRTPGWLLVWQEYGNFNNLFLIKSRLQMDFASTLYLKEI